MSDGALMLIARAADGGMRDALSILDMCLGYSNNVDETLVRSILGTSDNAFLFDYFDAMAENDAGKVFKHIDKLIRDGKDPSVFAKDVCRHVRALLIARTSPDDLVRLMDITQEEAGEYVQQSGKITLTRLMRILDLYMSLETEMRYSSSPRMALENAGVKSCLRLDEPDMQAVSDRISELEKKIDELNQKIEQGTVITASTGKSDNKTAAQAGFERKESIKKNTVRTPNINGQADQNTWTEMMSRIQKKDITAWSFLSQGQLISSTNRHFRWQAGEKNGEQQYISVLNKPERNKMICECLTEITGQECTFTAVAHDTVPVSDDNTDDDYLKTIYETFGKEPVNIVDEIK